MRDSVEVYFILRTLVSNLVTMKPCEEQKSGSEGKPLLDAFPQPEAVGSLKNLPL